MARRKSNIGLITKASAESSAGYKQPNGSTAENTSGNDSPTIGKAIPIISGGARPNGEVIWLRSWKDKNGACRGDIAICFGRNAFNRPLGLATLALNDVIIYSRKNGANINPPNSVRFYDGTHTAADPLIVSIEGADKTPAWVGYIYAVLEDVSLGDGTNTYQADFTDNQTDTSTGQVCDTALEGIDLKYNSVTGLFYGLENPGTADANVITSDGCTILWRNKVVLPWEEDDGGHRIWPVAFSLSVVKCSTLVTVTGWVDMEYTLALEPNNQPPKEWICDPNTGVLFGGAEWQTAPSSSVYVPFETYPADTGIEIKESFVLGVGSPGQFAVMRFFTRGDTYYESQNGVTLPLRGNSSIAGTVFDINERLVGVENVEQSWQGLGRYVGISNTDITGGIGPALDVGLVSRAVPVSPGFPIDGTYTALGWWLDEAPALDDFIFLKNEFDRSNLGGVKASGGNVDWYLMEYDFRGLKVSHSGTIIGVSASWEVTGLNYDVDTDEFLIGVKPNPAGSLKSRIYKISASGTQSYVELGAATWNLVRAPNGVVANGMAPVQSNDGTQIGQTDLTSGDTTVIYNGTAPTGDPVVDLSRNLISLPTLTGRTQYAISQVTVNDIALSDLITDICTLKGYSSSDLVFEGFTGLVARGMTISSTTAVTDLLNRLGHLYGFVFAETDGKLKFRRRRSSSGTITPDWTLTDSDLIEASENIVVQRQAATTVLGSLGLTWLDPDRDYETNSLMARRIVGVLSGESGKRDEEISLPLAIDQETARKLLFESFYAQAEGETRVSFSVGPEFLRIEPGDLISLTADGSTRIVQARRVTHRADVNSLDIEADTFMSQATPTIGSAGGNTGSDPGDPVAGAYLHLDIPLIAAADYPKANFVRQYHGLTTYDASTWNGADFYTSPNGSRFTKLFEYDTQPMTVAVATNALGSPPQNFALDETETLTIRVVAGDATDFSTVTYSDMMSEVTLCAYGIPGAWEIISFQTVTDNLDGTLTLSNLQRGLYGTHKVHSPVAEGGLGSLHRAGDYVAFLDGAKVRSTVWAESEIGRRDNYAVVTADVGLSAAVRPRHQMPGTSMRPPPVANVIVEHEAASTDLYIYWDEVSPIPHPWFDTGAPGLMPETYTYDIEIVTVSHGTITGSVSGGFPVFTWDGYGTTIGANVRAADSIVSASVRVTSPVWGTSFTTSAFEIRDA